MSLFIFSKCLAIFETFPPAGGTPRPPALDVRRGTNFEVDAEGCRDVAGRSLVIVLPDSRGLVLPGISNGMLSPGVGESLPARSVASVLYLGIAVLLSGEVRLEESRESVEDKGKPATRATVPRLLWFNCPANDLGAAFIA